MFNYYGSKCKIAKYYPRPKFDLIIEPFAGAAWYSVLYRNNNVILNEKYDIIYNIWNWLINDATSQFINENKTFYLNQDISKINLPKSYKDLIGFCINRGSIAPRNIVQKWSCQVKSKPNWASTTEYRLGKISELLPEIKHWKIKFGDYKEIPNIKATWFIDSPYQFGGEHYLENNINYDDLANWCKSRKGQVIVCENDKASWLDFNSLIKINGQRKKSNEVIWYKEQ